MSEMDGRLRYAKLKGVTFEMAPQEEWAQCYRDLLEFEAMLVFGAGVIGYAPQFPLSFEVTDTTPIRSKPIIYPKE